MQHMQYERRVSVAHHSKRHDGLAYFSQGRGQERERERERERETGRIVSMGIILCTDYQIRSETTLTTPPPRVPTYRERDTHTCTHTNTFIHTDGLRASNAQQHAARCLRRGRNRPCVPAHHFKSTPRS